MMCRCYAGAGPAVSYVAWSEDGGTYLRSGRQQSLLQRPWGTSGTYRYGETMFSFHKTVTIFFCCFYSGTTTYTSCTPFYRLKSNVFERFTKTVPHAGFKILQDSIPVIFTIHDRKCKSPGPITWLRWFQFSVWFCRSTQICLRCELQAGSYQALLALHAGLRIWRRVECTLLRWLYYRAVSYTHLTLPTKRIV